MSEKDSTLKLVFEIPNRPRNFCGKSESTHLTNNDSLYLLIKTDGIDENLKESASQFCNVYLPMTRIDLVNLNAHDPKQTSSVR